MFFILSKLFWVLAKPLNLIWVLMSAGFLLRFIWKRLGTGLLISAAVIFIVLGLIPVGPNMMTYLERQYVRPDLMPAHIDGIIVLGGAFDGYMSHLHGYPVGYGSTERIHEFIRLGQYYPDATMLFSGGSGRPRQQTYKEAPVIEDFFETLGLSTDRLVLEPDSRNTYQNAIYSYELMKPEEGERWLLVTSASHMPRAMAIFDKLGWEMIAYPTDHNTDLNYHWIPDNLQVSKNFYMMETALKEFIGTAIYYWTGKSSLPFPRKIVPSEPQ